MTPPLQKILFLDIETAPLYYNFTDLSDKGKELWEKKTKFLKSDTQTTKDIYHEKAGIFSEFSKVICISLGVINNKQSSDHTNPSLPLSNEKRIYLTSLKNKEEKELLLTFKELVNNKFPNFYLCAHNGKEFDFPFICRRFLANGIQLPDTLNIMGKKPWEIMHLDTMELWKFGDYKNYTSLDLLAYTFNIPSPKDEINGEDVSKVYHVENDLEKIVTYCQKDVITLIQVYLRIQGKSLIDKKNITFIDSKK